MSARKTSRTEEIDFLEADVKSDFYTAKKQIESAGYVIPSLEEFALARINYSTPSDSPLMDDSGIKYCWTRDFSIYVPGENGIYLSKSVNSPIIENDKPWFTRKGNMWPYEPEKYDEKGIYFNESELARILEDSIFIENPDAQSEIIRLAVPTASFQEYFLTSYLFGEETAQKYGEMLKQITGDNAKFIHLELGNKKKLHARQLCLGNILTTNNIITNKCRLHVSTFGSQDARMIGLRK